MYTIFVTIIVFAVAVIIHILLFRYLLSRGHRSFIPALVFVGIFMSMIIIIGKPTQIGMFVEYKITALTVFVLLTMSYMVMTASLILGDESPSSKIILEVEKKPGISESKLITLFSDKKLVDKRLEDMLSSGMITQRGRSFMILPKGQILVFYVTLYHKLLGWKELG